MLAAVLAVLLLAGCRPEQAPRLATTPAERASWPPAPPEAVAARVERVVDGDTFVAAVAGRSERIRLIGVDTPETVDPDRPVQPYGREASSFAKHMLSDRTVRLEGDVEPRDRYGRLLAYVWLPDGDLLERAAGGRGLRAADHHPARRELRRAVPRSGRGGTGGQPGAVGRAAAVVAIRGGA